ncbi:MAG: DUF554 domain-containing protein [Coprothermobacterota bacterium]|nr:DUF554 domain-containing protein [Coprothermobacterota bacterium]
MIGTLINTAAVIVGSLSGLLIGRRIPARYLGFITQAIGIITLILGVQMAMKMVSVASGISLLLALIFGGLLGEWLAIEDAFASLGRRIENRFKFKDRDFVQGFLTASLLFCLGPMTILGSLQDGLQGDFQLLLLKSIMDGASSIFLAGSLGIGVLFSFIVVLVYQGGLTLLAKTLSGVFTDPVILALTIVGGALVICLGLNLLEIKKIKVANFLPAIVFAPLFQLLFERILPG